MDLSRMLRRLRCRGTRMGRGEERGEDASVGEGRGERGRSAALFFRSTHVKTESFFARGTPPHLPTAQKKKPRVFMEVAWP